MTIGERIKKRRKELGLSVDELSEKLGKNRATVYRYESNDIEKLPTTVLEPLAKVLNVSPAYLMGWVEPTKTNIIKYPSEEDVNKAISEDEPLLVLISFDGKTAIMSHIDEAVEHHVLLMNVGYKDTDIDKFFRIVLDKSGADWTFVCPPDYKNIPFKDKRIEAFYKDGFTVISDFLHSIGYLVGINIPKRYRRHLNVLGDDSNL